MVVFVQKLLYSGKFVVFGQTGFSRAKVVVIGQKWSYSGKVVVFGQKLLSSAKRSCIRVKEVKIGQILLYSGKSGCVRAVVVFGQNWLYSCKVVVFGQKLF